VRESSRCGCNAVVCFYIVLNALTVALMLFSGGGSDSGSAQSSLSSVVSDMPLAFPCITQLCCNYLPRGGGRYTPKAIQRNRGYFPYSLVFPVSSFGGMGVGRHL